MLTLEESMRRVARTHFAWNDPAYGYLPFGGWETAHDTGRWVDAVLRLEETIGIAIPPEIEKAVFEGERILTDNPYAMLLNRSPLTGVKPDDPDFLNFHNLREGVMSLERLCARRGLDWAAERLVRLGDTMKRVFFDGTLRPDEMASALRLNPPGTGSMLHTPGNTDFTESSGRALEGLLYAAETTGENSIRELADRVAEYHLAHDVNPDGSPAWFVTDEKVNHHTHSYLGTLRGLLLYGLKNGRSGYVEAVKNTYDRSLWKHNVSESGYVSHDLGKAKYFDREGNPVGDHGSLSDVLWLAAVLGEETGEGKYYDDLERLLFCRLLPLQKVSFDPRMDGGWGITDGYFGGGVVLDCFAAVANALCRVYAGAVTKRGGKTFVNLHADLDLGNAKVRASQCAAATASKKPGDRRKVTALLPKRGEVCLRLPAWTDPDTAVLLADGEKVPIVVKDGYVSAGSCREATLEYDRFERTSVEYTRVTKDAWNVTWLGSEILNVREEKT